MVHLRRLYEAHGDRAQFLFVYITEPPQHVLPEFLRPAAEGAGLADAAGPAARLRRVVAEGTRHYELPFPCLLDEDRRVEQLYRASPLRVVLVDTDGVVAVSTGNYPGAKVGWEEFDSWLAAHVPGGTRR